MKHFIGTTLNYFIHIRAWVCVCVYECECKCSRKRATRGILAAACQEEHAENSMAFGEAACTVADVAAAAHISLIRTIVQFRCGALMRSAWSDRVRTRALPLLFSIF